MFRKTVADVGLSLSDYLCNLKMVVVASVFMWCKEVILQFTQVQADNGTVFSVAHPNTDYFRQQ